MSKKDVVIEVINLKEVTADMRKFGRESLQAIKNAVYTTGLGIATIAKGRLNGSLGSVRHWVSGRLASSVHMETKGTNTFTPIKDSQAGDGELNIPFEEDEAIVGTNVEYAPKIEFEYDSFLRFAGENKEPEFVKEAEKSLNELMKKRAGKAD